jgi:hypothetical protein
VLNRHFTHPIIRQLAERHGAVSKVPNRSEKVILNLFQDLIINGLRFRNEFGMTLSTTFNTAPAGGELRRHNISYNLLWNCFPKFFDLMEIDFK